MYWGSYGFRPYVPVSQKIANATKFAAQTAKKQGRKPSPVLLDGRKIAKTFWGKAWCDNLEAYSDYANRLPRGATYLRNGSVVDLVIKPRTVEAIVAGSTTYTIKIDIRGLAKGTWSKIKQECSASIDSLIDLLAGRFSDGVMRRLTRQEDGLFPKPAEIKMSCNCPDWSGCCKHLAAVMYGIGARLDKQPELLFLLRDVDHQELVSEAVADGNLERELAGDVSNTLAGEDLGAVFGIELEDSAALPSSAELAPGKQTRKPKQTRAVKATKSAAFQSLSDQPPRAQRLKPASTRRSQPKVARKGSQTTEDVKPDSSAKSGRVSKKGKVPLSPPVVSKSPRRKTSRKSPK